MLPRHGFSCPVAVADAVDWNRDYSKMTLGDLLAMPEEELATVDPLAMNLLVAKGIPELARLDISEYQATVNAWTGDFRRRCLPQWEPFFYESPQDFRNDIRYFRLGMICQYLDLEIGIGYNLEQRTQKKILYTNPLDLFLNGILDTKQGTCGNMSALHVAMGWRMGWPVTLACAGSHYICRYDDGKTIFNIEATDTGGGGWASPTDKEYIKNHKIPPRAVATGSDLRALRRQEMLGVFVGLRARHLQDVGKSRQSEPLMLRSDRDWLLAQWLFPYGRIAYRNGMAISAIRGEELFHPHEVGHPLSFIEFLSNIFHGGPPAPPKAAPPLTEADLNFVISTLGK